MKFIAILTGLSAILCAFAPPAAAAGGSSSSRSKSAKSKLIKRESSDTLRRLSRQKALQASIKAGPLKPSIDQSHRKNFPDPKTLPNVKRPGAYPWHFDITATYFYIGERPTKNNPTPNTASSARRMPFFCGDFMRHSLGMWFAPYCITDLPFCQE